MKQNIEKIDKQSNKNGSHLTRLCSPKLSSTYFTLSIISFILPTLLLTMFLAMQYGKDYKNTWCFNAKLIVYIHVLVPLLSIYHGFQGFCPQKLKSVTRFSDIDDPRDLQFLKLFEQFGEALPQFVLGLTFYINNSYFIDTYDTFLGTNLEVTLVSITFSGVSILLGIITGLASVKSAYDDGTFP